MDEFTCRMLWLVAIAAAGGLVMVYGFLMERHRQSKK